MNSSRKKRNIKSQDRNFLTVKVRKFRTKDSYGLSLGFEEDHNFVAAVECGSPSAEADLRVGDQIASINGVSVTKVHDIYELIRKFPNHVEFDVVRVEGKNTVANSSDDSLSLKSYETDSDEDGISIVPVKRRKMKIPNFSDSEDEMNDIKAENEISIVPVKKRKRPIYNFSDSDDEMNDIKEQNVDVIISDDSPSLTSLESDSDDDEIREAYLQKGKRGLPVKKNEVEPKIKKEKNVGGNKKSISDEVEPKIKKEKNVSENKKSISDEVEPKIKKEKNVSENKKSFSDEVEPKIKKEKNVSENKKSISDEVEPKIKKEKNEKQLTDNSGIQKIKNIKSETKMVSKLKSEFFEQAVDKVCSHIQADKWAVKNCISLLEGENTVPFIARYRKEKTGNMEVETIRNIESVLEEFKVVKNRVASVQNMIEKQGKLSSSLKDALNCTMDINEVEHLYAPFKQGAKGTLVERAKVLGLTDYASHFLENFNLGYIKNAINQSKEGLKTFCDVKKGIQHIIADKIAKDMETLDKIRELCKGANISLLSLKSKRKVKIDKTAAVKKGSSKSHDEDKFKLYFDFRQNVKYVKPHQMLAINRGEKCKFLTVKIGIPENVKHNFKEFCCYKMLKPFVHDEAKQLLITAINDSYDRILEPLMMRKFRSELTKDAEKASVNVFATNLKSLLLTAPYRGKVILGIDPGFRNGCKYAVISNTGLVLDTGIFYFHEHSKKQNDEESKLIRCLQDYRCDSICIGNGVACRETEIIVAKVIKQNKLDAKYTIVSENGASIYSASEIAQSEFPHLDVSLRGSVSIARRLQDPLAELVKIDPKHIGVGMYQHDVNEVLMRKCLDGVVEECVSFVGVDINVCSEHLLRKIAGLNSAKAKSIIDFRTLNGAISNREQLLLIKGIGPKSYEQCAGFVRILPGSRERMIKIKSEETECHDNKKKIKMSTKTSDKNVNYLDMTLIHPESYPAALSIIELLNLNSADIGKVDFILAVKNFKNITNIEELAHNMKVGVPTLDLILTGLNQSIEYDMRDEFEIPLFKQSISKFEDLKIGEILTGKVCNCTHFGAFVDIGVGKDGLIHSSCMHPGKMNGKNELNIGDRVEVKVQNIIKHNERISLDLLRIL